MYFLGVDVSTTSSKALLIDEKGQIIGVESSPHTLQSPRPLWSEQDPLEWWKATSQSIQSVIKKAGIDSDSIGAVGLTGQMHGLVLLDESGDVLRPAILWNDQRTQAQCDEIHQGVGKERFIQITGNVCLTGFTASKIMWVKENEPEIYQQVKHILLPKDYIRYRLSGDYAMDKADGSGTVLFDLKSRDWSAPLLETLDINPAWLPPTFEGTEFTGSIAPEAAEQTGLKVGTPIVAGGGDQAAQAVGIGAVESGIIGLTVGTSGVVFAPTSAGFVEPEGRLHAFCHAVPGLWHFMGVMLSAAGSLQWYRDKLAPNLDFDTLVQEAETVPVGSEGLQFLPYLSGERTPYPDPLARAGWIGISARHGRAYLTRALLEGVSYAFKDIFSLIQTSGLEEIKEVRVSGGGMKSRVWREIMASVLNTELITVNATEGAAFGAALLAGVGSGNWPDVPTACQMTISRTGLTQPDARASEIYAQAYPIFRELYPVLAPSFIKMNEVAEGE
ncbi:MAG: xylulokinase [Brevefilum sp.]|jgi:xylulokinase